MAAKYYIVKTVTGKTAEIFVESDTNKRVSIKEAKAALQGNDHFKLDTLEWNSKIDGTESYRLNVDTKELVKY